jgi:hypothetical protein
LKSRADSSEDPAHGPEVLQDTLLQAGIGKRIVASQGLLDGLREEHWRGEDALDEGVVSGGDGPLPGKKEAPELPHAETITPQGLDQLETVLSLGARHREEGAFGGVGRDDSGTNLSEDRRREFLDHSQLAADPALGPSQADCKLLLG